MFDEHIKKSIMEIMGLLPIEDQKKVALRIIEEATKFLLDVEDLEEIDLLDMERLRKLKIAGENYQKFAINRM